jgi:hypothetical protein
VSKKNGRSVSSPLFSFATVWKTVPVIGSVKVLFLIRLAYRPTESREEIKVSSKGYL